MKRWLATLATAGMWAVLGASSALAQLGTYNPPQVTPGPSFSPYLNMIRNNPAVNYFGIVQPQMNTYGALQQLQQNQQYGQGAGNAPFGLTSQAVGTNNALITGHPVVFGYSAQYFPIGNQLAGMGQGAFAGGGAGGLPTTGFGGANFGAGLGIGGAGPTINTPLPLGFIVPGR